MLLEGMDRQEEEKELLSFLERVKTGEYARVHEDNLLYVRMNEVDGYNQFSDDDLTYSLL